MEHPSESGTFLMGHPVYINIHIFIHKYIITYIHKNIYIFKLIHTNTYLHTYLNI